MTLIEKRLEVIKNVKESAKNGARLRKSCELIGLTLRTFQRWLKTDYGDKRPNAFKSHPKTLSLVEKKNILNVCNSPEYAHLTPNEIVPLLAEKGQYLASESTFYNILRQEKLLKHRLNSKPPRKNKRPPGLVATGPNQVWSWDITYLKSSVRGLFFYLYLFMDIWSRKIVGWTVEEIESGEIASEVIKQLCIENKIESLYLHSDNGSPMTCGTMKAMLERLGVMPSYSRPRISNDNPFSESLFKTLKYRPSFPNLFKSVEDAREWTTGFEKWYNLEHLHSGIKFVTPEQRHTGADREIFKKRDQTYILAKTKNPLRWVGETRNWQYQETVKLNKIPEKIKIKKIS